MQQKNNGGKEYKKLLVLAAAGLLIGSLAGAIDAVFGSVLLAVTEFREVHYQILLPFLAVGGGLVVWIYQKYAGNAKKGMSLIFQAGQEGKEEIPLRLIPLIMGGTWLTHLFGGSAGREGVAVQIGAAISHFAGKRLPFPGSPQIFVITGMAAGFSGLFQTPAAAVLFALEALAVGRLQYQALIPAATASFTASWVSNRLGLEKFQHLLELDIQLSPSLVLKLAILGICFGLTGAFFAWSLEKAKGFLAGKIKDPVKRIVLVSLGLSLCLLAFHQGRYAGLGTNLISDSLAGGEIYAYDWICKLVFTIVTLAAGFQGGEVTPLFSIGASLGVFLSSFLGVPAELAAALGYAGVFCGATNTFLAPVFIGAEVFGFEALPWFFGVCAISFAVNQNRSIYGAQKKEF